MKNTDANSIEQDTAQDGASLSQFIEELTRESKDRECDKSTRQLCKFVDILTEAADIFAIEPHPSSK